MNKDVSVVNEQKQLMDQLAKVKDEIKLLLAKKEELIAETKAEIQQQKNNWEIERQQYIEKAETEGFNKGFAQGKQESMEQYKKIIEEANMLMKAAEKDYKATIEQSDEAILDISMKVAEKIINRQLADHRDSFVDIVTAAINEVKDKSTIKIHLHPMQYSFVLQQKEELASILEPDTKVAIYMDTDLPELGCIIEHSFGKVDASIDTQLNQIRQVLSDIAMENEQ